jgi:transcriptional repressor NrdR
VIAGVTAACKGRPVSDASIQMLAEDVEALVRTSAPGLSTETIGRAVLDRLRCLDQVAYLRFASVYKGFDNAADFARELQLLEAAEVVAERGADA